MMKYMKLIAVVCAAAWAVASTPESYAGPRKRAKEGKEQTVRKTPYEKLFDGRKHTTAVGELVTLHKIDGKVFFEIPLASMGRDMLLGTTPASTMYVRGCVAGLRQQAPMHVAFNLEDSTVVLVRRNDAWLRKSVSERVGTAVAAVGCDNIVGQYRIKVCNDDRTAVVIDATELFCTDIPELSPIGEGYDPFDISAVMKTGLTRVTDVRSLNGELYVCTSTQYSVSEWRFIFPVAVNLPVDVDVVFSLVPMPEESMRPRPADDRIGLFMIEKKVLSEEGGPVGEVKYAARWNIVPADTAAYLRGELTDPVRPITMYMDPNMPETWREPVKRGILSWNRAFEKAGFREVIRVEDFPKDDPAFNPYGINTSCVWYAPSNIENAEGHFWTDPRTGEIRGATMVLHQHVAAKINRWRFVQTAQIDPRVRNVVMPREVMDESLAYVAAHEMGHCLGLAHNMAGSSAIPVDSLRSATFTQKYGTTASIMDYARFNYVAQPEDGITQLTPKIGTYDKHAINWGYRWLGAKDPHEELPTLNAWLREHEDDPEYWYGEQRFQNNEDPRSQSEDLSDDAVAASLYGLKNLQRIVPHITDWTAAEGELQYESGRFLMAIVFQWMAYADHVKTNVGGFYLNNVVAGHDIDRYVPVPADYQRKSVKYLIDQVFTIPEWLFSAKAWNKAYAQRLSPVGMMEYSPYNLARELQYKAYYELLADERMVRMYEVEARQGRGAKTYTPEQMMDDITRAVFIRPGGRTLSIWERMSQKNYLDALIVSSNITMVKTTKLGSTLHDHDGRGCCSLMQEAPEVHLEPLPRPEDMQFRTARNYELMKRVSETTSAKRAEMRRLLTLVQSRTGSGDQATRNHYRDLELRLKEALRML